MNETNIKCPIEGCDGELLDIPTTDGYYHKCNIESCEYESDES